MLCAAEQSLRDPRTLDFRLQLPGPGPGGSVRLAAGGGFPPRTLWARCVPRAPPPSSSLLPYSLPC